MVDALVLGASGATREGSSPFVRRFCMIPRHGGNRYQASLRAGCAPEEILDFSASINPFGPPIDVGALLRREPALLTDYPDPESWELRNALAKRHGLDPDWILPGNGAAELLTWMARDFARKGGAVTTVAPAFADYERALSSFEVPIIRQPMTIPEFDLPDLPGGMGLILNNPHNPSGKLFARGQLESVLEDYDLVLVDEAFLDFVSGQEAETESFIPLVAQYPNLVVLRSLTKFYSLAGIRLGYAIAHPDRLARWQAWRDPWVVNALAQRLGTLVLTQDDFRAKTLAWIQEERAFLFQSIANIEGLTPLPSAVNFLLVHSDFSIHSIEEKLLKRDHILIRHCGSFELLGDAYFRISIRTRTHNHQLIDALKAYVS
jgi:L-threonine-O-3-phosphate decarboxylase